jgi:hypothetical protein
MDARKSVMMFSHLQVRNPNECRMTFSDETAVNPPNLVAFSTTHCSLLAHCFCAQFLALLEYYTDASFASRKASIHCKIGAKVPHSAASAAFPLVGKIQNSPFFRPKIGPEESYSAKKRPAHSPPTRHRLNCGRHAAR